MGNKFNAFEKKGHVKIDWGRQGGVIFAYIVILLGYFGIIANTVMVDEFGDWLNNTELDPSVLFWTYKAYSSPHLAPILFILIFLLLSLLIIFFSIKEWHSLTILMILIPVYLMFILDIYWNLFNLPAFILCIAEGDSCQNLLGFFNVQGLVVLLLFFVSFVLTYSEDVPYYGIKASIWLVPFLIIEAFIFHLIIFGFSFEPLILQFGRLEGYINILLLMMITLSGSNLGKRMKIYVTERLKTEKVK